MTALLVRLTRAAAKLPVHIYRWTLKPFFGFECRYGPSCSQYALDAIDLNGAWRGSWLAVSRFARCRPGGSSGFDPAPDIRGERHPFAPWRYGRWQKAEEIAQPMQTGDAPSHPHSKSET